MTFKKTVGILLAATLTFTLAACGHQGKTEKKTSNSSQTATITLDFDNDKKADETKTFAVKKDQTLLEAVKSSFKVVEKDGFITAIDGKSQDTANQKYWLFKVNGKLASKGAADTIVKKGDQITFYLGNF
ncbi:DUF4430 domain-containing protein [Pseudolactococcus insecticola]|uniref:Transcobalamin-like C-terminal domain-containing protein n=1 Tax=Pseudolactococcus insecticola TaxID=2709158 RepID=A0A6A0BBB5_9LACT|nr:DUF4430 domain-containing protein [Lactococcus insecticola]GFH41117.1 hypothetical protein Hs20B_15150 [Lactococcus insecticola]